MDIPGTIQTINKSFFSDANAGRTFSASLPSGTYTAEFINQDGALAWPQYVEEKWNKPPDCSGYATVDSVTLIKPAIAEQQCVELVRNGGKDDNILTTEPWIHTMYNTNDVIVRSGLGVDGSNAIGTVSRQGHWTGLGQNIDSRCLDLMKGKYYEFSALIKVTALNDPSTPIQTINPNKEWYNNLSPIMTINGRGYSSVTTKEFSEFPVMFVLDTFYDSTSPVCKYSQLSYVFLRNAHHFSELVGRC
jgi:hypothetical protein